MRGLALDFDGVVADGLAEVWVVAIRAFAEACPDAALASRRARLEAAGIDGSAAGRRFRALTPLGNRAEEFGVALRAIEVGVELDDQKAWDRFSSTVEPAWKERYHELFYEKRAALRAEGPERWLELQPPFAPIVDLLRRRGREVELAIATAKDARSVRLLLDRYGIGDLFARDRVLDKESGASKRAHIAAFAERSGVRPSAITFVDDKVNHLEDVAPLGARCVLAAWGYNGDRECRRAVESGFEVATLDAAEAGLFGAKR